MHVTMLGRISIKGLVRSCSNILSRESRVSETPLSIHSCFAQYLSRPVAEVPFSSLDKLDMSDVCRKRISVRYMSKSSVELKAENGVVRFYLGDKPLAAKDSTVVRKEENKVKRVDRFSLGNKPLATKDSTVEREEENKVRRVDRFSLGNKPLATKDSTVERKEENKVRRVDRFSLGNKLLATKDSTVERKEENKVKRVKKSKRAKIKELKFYRLMARKKMNSPNPAVRIRYKLEKAKRKEVWLIEKLRKFEVQKAPAEAHDPESLTEEEKHYLKRSGEKKKHYVPVGRRGVFGGVVLNMHLHWKNHETVKVTCRPCKPGQLQEYAQELCRLSKGIVIDIKHDRTIIFYRGKNYVRPEVMSPTDTLSKAKALAKYKYMQSLEHTSEFIENLEKELEEYHNHLATYKQNKEKEDSKHPSG